MTGMPPTTEMPEMPTTKITEERKIMDKKQIFTIEALNDIAKRCCLLNVVGANGENPSWQILGNGDAKFTLPDLAEDSKGHEDRYEFMTALSKAFAKHGKDAVWETEGDNCTLTVNAAQLAQTQLEQAAKMADLYTVSRPHGIPKAGWEACR